MRKQRWTPRPEIVNTFNLNSLPAPDPVLVQSWAAVRDGRNVYFNSSAGSGKSTAAILTAANMSDLKIAVLVFNKKNSDELKSKVPGNVSVSTYASMAKSQVPDVSLIDPKDSKDRVIDFFTCLGVYKETAIFEDLNTICRIADLARLTLQNVTDVMRVYELDLKEISADHITQYLEDCRYKIRFNRTGEFSDIFNYVSEFEKIKFEFDLIILDEAQDISPAMVNIIRATGCQIMAVGDDSQAINGFAGAVRTPMAETYGTGFNAVPFNLLKSWRLPVSHVAQANKTRPETLPLTVPETAIQGTLVDSMDLKAFIGLHWQNGLIVARTNYDVLELAIRLFTSGYPFRVITETPLKVICTPLYKVLKGLQPSEFAAVFQDYIANNQDKEPEDDRDLTQATVLFCQYCLDKSITDCRAMYKLLETFTDSKTGPYIMTAHKAKGSEAHNVAVYNRANFGPGRRLGLSEFDQKQEIHLQHVADSRSKNTLVLDIPRPNRPQTEEPTE